jgi:hypothetical protein
MLVDPYCTVCIQAGAYVYALEVADPVEASSYTIDGIEVSNFVTPNWFRLGAPGPYDYLNKLSAPTTALDGGYFNDAVLGHWVQTNQENVRRSKIVPGAGTRRAKRGVGRR